MRSADRRGERKNETEDRTGQIDDTLKRMQRSLSTDDPAAKLHRNRDTLTFGHQELRRALAARRHRTNEAQREIENMTFATTLKFTALSLLLAVGVAAPASAGGSNVSIEQYGQVGVGQRGGHNRLTAFQNGRSNTAISIQDGHRNRAVIAQTGRGNFADGLQRGKSNIAGISQIGQGNEATTTQKGRGNAIGVIQAGDGNTADVVQKGRGNVIVIVQD